MNTCLWEGPWLSLPSASLLESGRWGNKNTMLVKDEAGAEGAMFHFPECGPGALQAYESWPCLAWHQQWLSERWRECLKDAYSLVRGRESSQVCLTLQVSQACGAKGKWDWHQKNANTCTCWLETMVRLGAWIVDASPWLWGQDATASG